MTTYRRVAYGSAPKIKSSKILNAGATVGTKIVQLVYLRPPLLGYTLGRGNGRSKN